MEPLEYRMKVHLLGAASSPGCCNFVLKYLADVHHTGATARASHFIKDDVYVDDGLVSVSSVPEAVSLVEQSILICNTGGLRLHKFVTNNKDVIRAVPVKDRASNPKNVDATSDSLPIERALGVTWCVESETFQFRICTKDQLLTRRGVLATVSLVYDPLAGLDCEEPQQHPSN